MNTYLHINTCVYDNKYINIFHNLTYFLLIALHQKCTLVWLYIASFFFLRLLSVNFYLSQNPAWTYFCRLTSLLKVIPVLPSLENNLLFVAVENSIALLILIWAYFRPRSSVPQIITECHFTQSWSLHHFPGYPQLLLLYVLSRFKSC